MFINYIKIENYRNFQNFESYISKLTLIVGENDSGKSNLISAFGLPLSGNGIDYNRKRLGVSDINTTAIKLFFDSIINKEAEATQLLKIPKASVTIRFGGVDEQYEKQIVANWLLDIDGDVGYEIKYQFRPKNDAIFLELVKEQLKDESIGSTRWFSLPIEHYDYSIISTNNLRDISYKDLKHVICNIIDAERDSFAESNSMSANSILTKLLVKTLSEDEKNKINSAYSHFFSEIEEQESFKKIIDSDDNFDNIKNYVEELKCLPNLPDLKNILSNITLGYGDEFLHQKGLGERNLVYIFLLFAYYKSAGSHFNLCCIEEPEAHLSVNNLRLAIDYIKKSSSNCGSLLQTILTTHSPNTINKLRLDHVLALSGNEAVSFANINPLYVDYLAKRPNFDILKLLFSKKTILVEGQSDEMLINTILSLDSEALNSIEVISIGQKGYRTFLDIWLLLNKGNSEKQIGIVRDFDNQSNAKNEHDKYDKDNKNITVRTTVKYTLEDELVHTGSNMKTLAALFKIKEDSETISSYMKEMKTEAMLTVCIAMQREDKPIQIEPPKHISEVLQALK